TALRAPGPHVPVGYLLESPLSPLPRLGLVGEVRQERQPHELPNRRREPRRTARRAAEPDRRRPALRLDRPHLPAAQAPRQLALLRRPRRPARLQRRNHVLQDDPAERQDAGHLESAALVHDGEAGSPARQRAAVRLLRPRRPERNVARSLLDQSLTDGERASARSREHRPGVRHRRDQHDHAEPELALDGDLSHLGRLGRLLRPRRPAARRRFRLRAARAGPRDQSLRAHGLRRSSDAQLRRVPEVHRGRLPRRRADQSEDGWTARRAAGRPREREDPRQPVPRLQLLAGSARAVDPEALPEQARAVSWLERRTAGTRTVHERIAKLPLASEGELGESSLWPSLAVLAAACLYATLPTPFVAGSSAGVFGAIRWAVPAATVFLLAPLAFDVPR